MTKRRRESTDLATILRKFAMHLTIATGYLQEALDAFEGKRNVRGNDGVLLATLDTTGRKTLKGGRRR